MTTTVLDRRGLRSGVPWPGLGLALASAAAFGLAGPLGSALLRIGWSPAAVVAARVGGAFLVLLVPCLVLLRRTGWPTARQLGRLSAYGVVAVAAAQLCFFSALSYLSVGVALLLEYTAPVLLIGWFWRRSGRRPRLAVLAGAALALLGLVLVLDLARGLSVNPVGVAWGLAAAACLCVYFLLSEHNGEAPAIAPLVLTTAGTGIGAVVVLAVGAAGLFPLRAGLGATELAGFAVAWWLPIGLLMLISGCFAYLVGIRAVRRLGSSLASFVGLTEVIFAVVFAAVLLAQQPTPIQLVGGVLVLAGIAVVQRGQAR